jgi:regulatory protein
MIPIRNKRKSLKVTVEEMRNFAFAYVEKYAPSKQQLKTYLLKKYLKISVPNVKKQDVNNLIDIVLSDLEKNRFINDKFYSHSKAKSMIQRGSSINKIRNYLIGKGISEEFIKETVNKIKNENSDQDFFSAIKICKKKRIGPARVEDNRSLFYKKDISLLARNGFNFETSKKVMDLSKNDYNKIVKLL